MFQIVKYKVSNPQHIVIYQNKNLDNVKDVFRNIETTQAIFGEAYSYEIVEVNYKDLKGIAIKSDSILTLERM